MNMKCETCEFLEALSAVETGNPKVVGKCRRNPPSAFPVGQGKEISIFPMVTKHDWCGEFRPALATTETVRQKSPILGVRS